MSGIKKTILKTIALGQPCTTIEHVEISLRTDDVYDTTAREIPASQSGIPPRSTLSLPACGRDPSTNNYISSLKKFSFENIAHLKKKWIHDAKKHNVKKDKKSLKTCDNASLSPTFLARINYISPTIFQKENFKISLYAGVLEAEAFNQANQGSNLNLQKILLFEENLLRLSYSLTHETIKWRVRYDTEYQFGFIRLIQNIFNINWLDALATLASILNVSFEYMFSVYNVEHAAERNGFAHATSEITKHISFKLDEYLRHAHLIKLISIYGYSGQSISAIACYESNYCEKFTLPVAVAQGKLSIGKNKATAHFFNQDKMDTNHSATIFLCQDILSTSDLNDFFEHREEVVVVGHYGHDLSPLPWNHFYERKVILLCTPCIELYAMVDEYQAALQKAKAKEILIFPYPLLFKAANQTLDNIDFNPLEADLAANILDLTKEGSSYALRYICNKAMPYDRYESWGEDLGLFIKQKKSSASENSKVPVFTCEPHIANNPVNFDEVSLEHILPIKGVSLIYGKKNVGKSNVVFGLIKSLTQHQGFGGIKKVPSPHPVFLFDTETMAESFYAKLQQFGLETNLNDSLHCIVKLDCPPESEWGQFDLSTPEHRHMLQEFSYSVNTKHIFFDNITSGVKSGGSYTQKLFGDIFSWTPKLHEKNTGFTIVHHAHDDMQKSSIYAEVRGSNELIIRSHTIMILIGRDEIVQKITPSPDYVREAAKTPGATVGIYFKTCKLANILEGSILWGKLTQNASDWQWLAHTDLEGKELENSLLTPSVDFTPLEEIIDSTLSYEEKAVLKAFESNEVITISDAMTALKCKETKAQTTLKKLLEKGYIQKEGDSRSTKYLLGKG